MATLIDSISSINNTKETWKIVGLVVRVWTYTKNSNDDVMNSIKVIFVNKKV